MSITLRTEELNETFGDEDVVCCCDVCGEPIYVGEKHYCLPDDITIHDVCLREWAEQYRSLGSRW